MAITRETNSALLGPPVDPGFVIAVDDLVRVAKLGHSPTSKLFNPTDNELIGMMRVFQDLPEEQKYKVLQEALDIERESERLNGEGKAGLRAWPDTVVRLETGGLGFFSQLGVARRPDLTQYFIDGFTANRDAIAFSSSNQKLFAKIFPYITGHMEKHFASGDYIVQTDRQIGDAGDRSFHARQLLFGTDYPQLPYMWRQLTFDLPDGEMEQSPDILEVSLPRWLEDLGLPDDILREISDAGLERLVFKAPTKGLSLHLGFDYVGEHKMGPLSIAMFMVKQRNGLALQAALSMARIKDMTGDTNNIAMVTTGPSLHGKSTLTIMIELKGSQLASLLGLPEDGSEGIYPMNDDIVLLQRFNDDGRPNPSGVTYSIDGTENNFYAVPFGLNAEDDPITYSVLRGSDGIPNAQETLENVPFDVSSGSPDFSQNPVRNMRMILSRSRLLDNKGVAGLPSDFTGGKLDDMVHVPMESTDKVLWQGVMRQNTIVPPLVKLTPEKYVRALMFGEAVQTGASTGAIGRPYVEYFSDPFIIGLEDENANQMYAILQDGIRAGLNQEYYMFNTGGIGSDGNEQASGPLYKKITRELTLMLQEAVLRGAVRFEYDDALGVEIAVAIVDSDGREALDLRKDWSAKAIYGEEEYLTRVLALKRKRYYGENSQDKAGILRYTKADNQIFDIDDIPGPSNERELSWLISFYWNLDQAYNSIPELCQHLTEGHNPEELIFTKVSKMYQNGLQSGLEIDGAAVIELRSLGLIV